MQTIGIKLLKWSFGIAQCYITPPLFNVQADQVTSHYPGTSRYDVSFRTLEQVVGGNSCKFNGCSRTWRGKLTLTTQPIDSSGFVVILDLVFHAVWKCIFSSRKGGVAKIFLNERIWDHKKCRYAWFSHNLRKDFSHTAFRCPSL